MCSTTAPWSIPAPRASSPPTTPASAPSPAPARRNGHWREAALSFRARASCAPEWRDLRPVRRLPRAAIEHPHLFLGDHPVKFQRLRLEIALGHVSRLEMVIGVLAAHQRRPVAGTDGLLQVRRDIANGEPDAAFVGPVRLGAVEQEHMMQ